jgi:hypothetical protein
MIQLVRAASCAALTLAASPANAQQPSQGYTPPPGYVLVPAPPPGSTLQPAPAPPVAQNPTVSSATPERAFALSLQLGTNFGGTVTGEMNGHSSDYGLNGGLVGLARLDLYVVQRFTMGVYGQLLRTSTHSDYDFGVNGYGLSLIGRFGLPTQTHLRLGMLVGYQTNTTDISVAKDSRGLGLGAIAELAVPFSPNASFLAHVSFLSQAIGGNNDVSVTFAPVWYAAAGIEFGN